MKIALDYEIPVEVRENGKTIKELKVWFRELTAKEKKELTKKAKEFFELQKRLNRIERKGPTLQKKADAYNKLEKLEKEIEVLEQIEQLDDELSEIEEQITKLAGDDFAETQAKKSFDLRVSGDDKEKLDELAQRIGYTKILQMLEESKEGLLEKASTK